ncbi:hypothetical protein EIN_328180 [Entamoeba invadens IP1]|uniref:Uncharacterized protein n=1 Tax=Entamoeba invadens IP1 TaxID=370355 RepID=A0A0A1U3J8_ENTIV|nr:hypothetical protein EIN_328180 [Entamoeba invadens IP1]ELP86151.1 hypothetical protein EIN_328180 [Entamoeba invadens IP1]|eukprot:XP_004185497.1 hypothetical protein EIN_328180 [Entamoeba invadens IP1]
MCVKVLILSFFVIFVRSNTYQLDSTKLTAQVTYEDHTKFDFAVNIFAPCCNVNKIRTKCVVHDSSEKGSIDQTITYDYLNMIMTVPLDLPNGQYLILVYRHVGSCFVKGEPYFSLNYTSGGISQSKHYIMPYSIQTHANMSGGKLQHSQ